MKMNAINGSATLQQEVADVIDKDEFLHSIKKRIYLQAKEGFAINLQVLISRVESDEIRNVLINRVSENRLGNLCESSSILRKTRIILSTR